jgi:putative nucleotidyltransferase with HDIG domain
MGRVHWDICPTVPHQFKGMPIIPSSRRRRSIMLPVDPATPLDAATEHRLRDAERRKPVPLDRAQRRTELPLAALFVAIAGGLLLHGGGHGDLGAALVLVPALAVAYRIEFVIGAGVAMPTQLVFVPLLLTVPASAVPACVALAVLCGRVPDVLRGDRHPTRLLVCLNDAWYAVGPAIVVLVAAPGSPSLDDLPVCAAAILVQVVGDGLVSSARMAAVGIDPRGQARELAECWITDLLLAPVGFAAALAATATGPIAVLLVMPLGVLLRWFARERQARLGQALVLSETYRRIALLLGDVIGDDDEYTGDHSQGVVALAADVAEELGLDEQQRQLTELGALLHDVGKIQVPKSIINKRGPLDAAEWEVMRTHTVLGQDMLDRVGGWLAEVGVVVRASHERWDGGGYPDGLAGEAIPLAARIVACCDAYSAMTTDRAYRAARPVAEALTELQACAGTHFDPRVAMATRAVAERRLAATPPLRLAA